MEKEVMNIDETDTLLIRIALMHYIDFLEADNPLPHVIIQHMINHCQRLISSFDELVKRNN